MKKRLLVMWMLPGMLLAAELPEKLLPGEWRDTSPGAKFSPVAPDKWRAEIGAGGRWDSSREVWIDRPPQGKTVRFSAEVSGSRPGIAYLQIKKYRAQKELERRSSPVNSFLPRRLTVEMPIGDADRISLHYRLVTTPENRGETADFAVPKLELAPVVAAAAAEPALRIKPGFASCALTFHGLPNGTEKGLTGKLRFRALPDGAWQEAFPPVLLADGRTAEGTLFGLSEGTRYRVEAELRSGGEAVRRSGEFTTRRTAVPVARTIELTPELFRGHLVISERGTPDGYIRFTALPGTVLQAAPKVAEALLIDGAAYVILDGLTIRGGTQHGINLMNSEEIRIVNCDIAGWGTPGVQHVERDGKYFQGQRAINNHAGIRLDNVADLLIERNYIHDPAGHANSWFYSHPAGPNAVFAGKAAGVTLRYNDFPGSDRHRWNDAVEGWGNGLENGSFYRDAEIYGNYFAFGNDDGIELDGGQRNARFFGNLIEGMLCGISTAPCLVGPSYLVGNRIVRPGEEFGFTGSAIKNVFGNHGRGRIHLVNNTLRGPMGGASGYAAREKVEPFKDDLKFFSRNNIFATSGFFAPGLRLAGHDLDYDWFGGTDDWREPHQAAVATAAGAVVPNLAPDGVLGDGGGAMPRRPLGFTVTPDVLHFDSQKAPLTQVITVHSTDYRGTFTVRRNDASDFFSVTPVTGNLTPGKSVSLTVTLIPERIRHAMLNSGALLLRTPAGLSRVVSVFADSTGDAGLLAADRKAVVKGTVAPQSPDGETRIRFALSKPGKYYLFSRVSRKPYAVEMSLDGGPFERRIFLGAPLAGRPRWVNLGSATYNGEPNRPLDLTAGEHEVVIRRRGGNDYRIDDFALAATPGELLLAAEK